MEVKKKCFLFFLFFIIFNFISFCLLVVITLNTNENEKLIIIPCTKDPGFKSEFKITILSNSRLKLIPYTNTSHRIKIQGSWEECNSGGCINYVSWRDNPQYMLYVISNQFSFYFILFIFILFSFYILYFIFILFLF